MRVTAEPWAPGRIGRASRIIDFAANLNAFAADPNTTNVLDIVLVYLGAADLGPVDSQRIYVVARESSPGSIQISGRLTTTDTVTQYGQGYSTLASGTMFGTPSAVPARGLGVYRSARFTPSSITATHYNLVMNAGSVGHGGDSGGPSIVTVDNVGVGIAGVQSGCAADYLAGAPLNPPDWRWATRIRFCTYVSTEPFVGEIISAIKETPECTRGPACNIAAVIQYVLEANPTPVGAIQYVLDAE